MNFKELAWALGFRAFGAVKAEKIKKYEKILYERRMDGRECSIEEESIIKRTDPLIEYPFAKSIISLALPYNLYADEGSTHRVASYARGRDYHLIVKEKIDTLCERLKEQTGYYFLSLCDTTPLMERALAVECGIGFQGKNGSVIIEGIGANVVLGEIITDMEIIIGNEEIKSGCGSCMRCVKACPVSAITTHGVDAKKCLSYITQKKGDLTEEEGKTIENRLFGCDTCLISCPYNKVIKDDMSPNPYDIYDLFNMSNKEFREKYGKLSSSWRGKKILQRNALWNIKNAKK